MTWATIDVKNFFMITVTPIGFVRSTRIRMEDDNWDAENTPVELDQSQFSAEAFAGLATFSHVEIVFCLDQVDPAKIETTARHPRNTELMQEYWY